MAEELPDWLAEMRDQQLDQQFEEETPLPSEQVFGDVEESLEEPADLVSLFQEQPDQTDAPLTQEMGTEDVLDGLREQMALAEEEFEQEEGSPLSRAFSVLQPQQRLVLAVLIFLDVALCGCMALVMAGRVMPF